jgi:hypothetical protein
MFRRGPGGTRGSIFARRKSEGILETHNMMLFLAATGVLGVVSALFLLSVGLMPRALR